MIQNETPLRRLDVADLQREIATEEFDSTLLKHVVRGYKQAHKKIHDLMERGEILRIKKGIYVFAPPYNRRPISLEVLANMIYGPSALSLEWALSHHGMIPERVQVITSITPQRDKEFQTPLGTFTYRRLAGAKYAVGIEQVWITENVSVLMASPEKALIDLVYYQARELNFSSSKEVLTYLTDDLRISPAKLRTLRTDLLWQLARAYKKTMTTKIVEVLTT